MTILKRVGMGRRTTLILINDRTLKLDNIRIDYWWEGIQLAKDHYSINSMMGEWNP